MLYTLGAIRFGANMVIPFADKIPGLANNNKNEVAQAKNRINVAKSMKKSMENGKLPLSYLEVVDKMQAVAQKKIADHDYNNKQYIYNQFGKTAKILDKFIPGSGIADMGNQVVNEGKIGNLRDYAKDCPSIKNTVYKTMTAAVLPFFVPSLLSTAKSVAEPYLTVPIIIAAATVAAAVPLTIDAISYFRTKQTH